MLCGILRCSSILYWRVWKGRILAFCWRVVIELAERLLDVSRHRQMDLLLLVVPVERDSDVPRARPVFRDVVMLFEDVHEMSGVLAAFVFDSKVIDHECELDWSRVVAPEPGHQFALAVPVLVEALFKELVGKEPCLGKSIHTFGNLHIDVLLL